MTTKVASSPALQLAAACDKTSREATFAELLTAAQAAFGVEFSLLDGNSGEVLQLAADHARLDWTLRGELCREVARRGSAEVIEDDDPLAILALPLAAADGATFVAVGMFLTRPVTADESPAGLERSLGCGGPQLAAWLARQCPWQPEQLVRIARLLAGKLAAERQSAERAREIASLSGNLSSTYEEISLLYQLTQNLKLSNSDEEFGRKALDGLAAVLPVESLAYFWCRCPPARPRTVRTEPPLLALGLCPVDVADMGKLVELFEPGQQRPRVLNRTTTSAADWAYPAIRELIVVPLVEGNKVFGWLAAFNHARGLELGSVEASLLTSVAAILGIHSGNTELYREQAEFFPTWSGP